ncbi:amidase [Mesorhizobium sp. LjRoot246]|uniref:amidase n=1 Tax=Mesorhizobium sp. LjRoot246 TaxID=3342294 RepID=UPI003ECC9532
MLAGISNINEICQWTAKELTNAFAAGELSPVDAVAAVLERAEDVHAALNAFTVIDHDGALAAARASEKRWRTGTALSPIDGVPTTIKDIVQCQGLDVRYGSTTTSDISGQPDAPSVRNLRGAGAVIIGLTITPEFGWKAVTDNRKDGIARNPWDASKTPGGSSGGAAIAAAAGAGVLHLGTDGGGSIRIPASFTGVVGHKPSFGRVPAYPASSFGTVAHIGPMARTVEDAAAMLNAMSGRDLRDWAQPPKAFPDVSLHHVNWSEKRVGYWKTPCVGGVDQSVTEAVDVVLRDLELAGARIAEIRLPEQDALLEIFFRHWYVGAANRLSSINPGDHDMLDPGFVHAARIGQRYTAVERMQAETRRAQFGAQMDALLDQFDYVVSPSVPIPAFDIGYDVPKDSGFESSFEWSSFSFPINLSQQPACSVPCGFTADALPIGLQIIGARGDDEAVLSAALTYQQMYPERFLTPGGKWPAIGRRED